MSILKNPDNRFSTIAKNVQKVTTTYLLLVVFDNLVLGEPGIDHQVHEQNIAHTFLIVDDIF